MLEHFRQLSRLRSESPQFEKSKCRLDDLPDAVLLGLALCKEIVEAHKGTIEGDSTLGEGSVFTITLPT